jgi:outer membrane biosynthesis protein TonB
MALTGVNSLNRLSRMTAIRRPVTVIKYSNAKGEGAPIIINDPAPTPAPTPTPTPEPTPSQIVTPPVQVVAPIATPSATPSQIQLPTSTPQSTGSVSQNPSGGLATVMPYTSPAQTSFDNPTNTTTQTGGTGTVGTTDGGSGMPLYGGGGGGGGVGGGDGGGGGTASKPSGGGGKPVKAGMSSKAKIGILLLLAVGGYFAYKNRKQIFG